MKRIRLAQCDHVRSLLWILSLSVLACSLMTLDFRSACDFKTPHASTLDTLSNVPQIMAIESAGNMTIISSETQLPHQSATAADNSESMLSCLKTVLHNELPMSKTHYKTREKCPGCDIAFAHHWDAGHKELWSQAVEYRLAPMNALERFDQEKFGGCKVWEVGAHKHADDSKILMKRYRKCKFHAFEPIPTFAAELKENWNGKLKRRRMSVHAYGIGKENTTFTVPEAALKEQATYLGDPNSIAAGDQTVTAQVKSFDYAIEDAQGIPTLLHMNCEGCEWDFLPDAKKHGFLDKVPVIQIAWHNYGDVGLGARAWQLCKIREMLSQTHTMSNGLAFGWDRWELKET